jgi:hypothetical protein
MKDEGRRTKERRRFPFLIFWREVETLGGVSWWRAIGCGFWMYFREGSWEARWRRRSKVQSGERRAESRGGNCTGTGEKRGGVQGVGR